MAETVIQRKWLRKLGFVSEFKIDARWVLYADNDPRPQGSLRIVSHPDLPPGHVRAYSSFVTKRRPKTSEEIADTIVKHDLSKEELEIYSVDEHIELWQPERPDQGPLYKIEQTYGVKVFN